MNELMDGWMNGWISTVLGVSSPRLVIEALEE
jgi:hypothetical protein